MDAFDAIDILGDFEINRHRGQRIGVGRIQAMTFAQEFYGLAHTDAHRLVQAFVQPDGDPVSLCFGARQSEKFLLDQLKAEGAGERGFDGGEIDFAVALTGMAVAGHEQGAGHMHRQIEH